MRVWTEHEEQREFVRWFRQTYKGVLIFAIPNGGSRTPSTAGRLKAEGVLPGVPDLFIPKLLLWIEMKRVVGGTVSQKQKTFIKYLIEECGHTVILGKGFKDAKNQVGEFLKCKS